MARAPRSSQVAPIVLAALVLAGTACHKTRDDEPPPPAEMPSDWDPPTAAWGFHPVEALPCQPLAERSWPLASTGFHGSVEEVATASACAASLTADEGAIYWTDVGGAAGSIYRATRPDGQRPFRAEKIATDWGAPGDLVVAGGAVFWTAAASRGASAGVRVAPRPGRVVHLSDESILPSRLVAHDDGVYWLSPDGGGIRTAQRTGRGEHTAQDFFFAALTARLLAVDARNVYAVSDTRSLLAIPRDRSNATVLVSQTAEPVIDLAAHGGWLYWLEQERPIEGRCGNGPDAYASLKRVRITGGAVETVAEQLGDVSALSFPERAARGGAAWVTARAGAFRVEPTQPPDRRVTYEGGLPYGRVASIGDALVAATASPPSRIVLFTRP